ncbi:MAG: thioredoxin family protein [Ignavibacteriaceae bacterium]|nr:thioredoxin family protein [Ignavibacteriaceae bacterium]
MKNIIYSFVLIAIVFISFNFAQSKKAAVQTKTVKPKVTFVELGSVNCIPCKKMQSVMKAIEANYGDQVKVTFYDVWTEEQKPYAEKYKVRMIPTQVFLDTDGKEFFRHEGFYPETEIDKLLQSKGLKPVNKK